MVAMVARGTLIHAECRCGRRFLQNVVVSHPMWRAISLQTTRSTYAILQCRNEMRLNISRVRIVFSERT